MRSLSYAEEAVLMLVYSPRADLDKYGPAAVSKGKITQAQLDELHRQEAAHQNAMVHYPVFLASAVSLRTKLCCLVAH